MLDMIVVIENKNYGIKLINKISEKNKNIRLYSFFSNAKDTINILEKEKVDFLILEINFENSFGKEILEYIIKNDKKEYFNSIIVISNRKITNNPLIFECIDKPISSIKLFNCINNICDYKGYTDNSIIIRNEITNYLKYLNYNSSHFGTMYLVETIFEMYYKKDYLGNDIKNNIYSILAKRYNKSINTIYGDIKQATINMYKKCDEKIIIDFFEFKKYRKPKITEVIFRILNKLKTPHCKNKWGKSQEQKVNQSKYPNLRIAKNVRSHISKSCTSIMPIRMTIRRSIKSKLDISYFIGTTS